MQTYIASLSSVSPYFQSRKYEMDVPKLPKESGNDYEERTWSHRAHVDENGQIIIPAKQFRFSFQGAAQYLNERIPGRNRETWTKHFRSGLIIPEAIVLPERRENISGLWLAMNARGNRGPGPRVMRKMPFVARWAGDLTVHVLDDIITKEILERVIQHAGMFTGIGQNRPENGGDSGRYALTELVAVATTAPAVAAAAD